MCHVRCLVNPAYRITENESYMKSAQVRLGVYKVICLAVKHHGHSLAAQISMMQSLQYYEHLSEPMAECLDILAREFDHTQLCDEILREISGKTFSAQDSKGPRAFSRFLVRLTDLSPRLVLKQISLLMAHLDSEVSSLQAQAQFSDNSLVVPHAYGPCGGYRASHSRDCGVRGPHQRFRQSREAAKRLV